MTPSATISPNLWAVVGDAALTAPFPAYLTPDAPNKAGAIWTKARLWSEAFTVIFTFGVFKGATGAWATPTSSRTATRAVSPSPTFTAADDSMAGEGFTFVVHRSSVFNPLGAGAASLGYEGIDRSVALRFDTRSGAVSAATFGFLKGGDAPSDAAEVPLPAGLSWSRRSGYIANFTYDGLGSAYASVYAVQDPTAVYSSTAFTVDLIDTLGCAGRLTGCDSYFGFTAATSSDASSVHAILNFSYINARVTASPSQSPSRSASFSSTSSMTASATGTPAGPPVDPAIGVQREVTVAYECASPIGAAVTGMRPIFEFQFSDFATLAMEPTSSRTGVSIMSLLWAGRTVVPWKGAA